MLNVMSGYLSLIASPPLSLVFFVGACLGHTALLVYFINRFYSLPLPRKVLSNTRRLDGYTALAGYALFGWSLVLGRLPDFYPPWGDVVAGYALLCCLLGYVVLPPVLLKRVLARRPVSLLGNHSRVLDVARELGYRPAGDGKHRRLALLPGNQVFQVEFSERRLCLPRLPDAWDGLTILHLSDLHFRGTPDKAFYRKVIEHCLSWGKPDLLAVTGDVVDSNKHLRWVIPLLGRLRWCYGAFAILGNHDSWYEPEQIRRRLRRLRMRVIGNGFVTHEVRGLPMVVIGHEGPWFRPAPDLKGCPLGFRLCLSHTPDNIAWARGHDIDLMLSGHVHGGQIRLPLVGSIFVPSWYGRKYDCGTFDEPPTVLHVSRGLAGRHPLRYNCRPEVTWLELKKG
jgi:predicted MPP superfamily phosphohydrolase